MHIENSNPLEPIDIVAGCTYFYAWCTSKRGGPGNSFDPYYTTMIDVEGLRVVKGETFVIDSRGEETNIKNIFLTDSEARSACPADSHW